MNPLISWDRSSVLSAGIRGLWSAGFILNRREIGARINAREEISDLQLAETLYKRFGSEAPQWISGPFAWILWDGDRQRFIAVRDRLGIHEIYYRATEAAILLCGDIEPLLASHPRVVNTRAVLEHVHGRAPAAHETFYQGISAVEPGGLLIATRRTIETTIYWRRELRPLLRLPDDASYARSFCDLFLPIAAEYAPAGEAGVTLSGGLDSTTVAAAIREAAPATHLTAFSWTALELPEADESQASAAVCRHLGCRAVTLAADQHWPLRTDPGIRPEPVSPLFNFYADLWDATFRTVREHGVRVLFSGLGGDNLFGGDVFSYPDLLLTGRWWKLASEIRMQRRYSELSVPQLVRWMTLAPIANTYIPARERSRAQSISWLGDRLRQEAPVESQELPRRLLPGRRQRLRSLQDPRLATIASLSTRQAARYGIELRYPLLDHRLFEFAAALPTAQTFAAGQRKIILRNAMRGRLPDAVVERRGKIYPEAIFRRGLREREQAKVWALMTDMRVAEMGFVDERRLRAAYDDYLAGRDRSASFWRALTLEVWLRRYFA
ncbi:MAG TPA: asparagine synthetase B family protein [Thermoanaerobaculia bacterium]|nr:asparagine synthetase B family protein [Thermoanaerobaculia bacterium]